MLAYFIIIFCAQWFWLAGWLADVVKAAMHIFTGKKGRMEKVFPRADFL